MVIVVVIVILQLLLLLLLLASFAAVFLFLLLAPPTVGHVPLEDPAYRPYFCILELGSRRRRRGEAELVHHPVGLGAPTGAAAVVDEGLLEPKALAAGAAVYGLVDAGGLPEAGAGDAVGPDAVPVLRPRRQKKYQSSLSPAPCTPCRASFGRSQGSCL